jgi:hypothetical protein
MSHPPPDRLIGDDNPALGEQVFDVAEAEREPQVEPNRLLNDLRLNFNSDGRSADRKSLLLFDRVKYSAKMQCHVSTNFI